MSRIDEHLAGLAVPAGDTYELERDPDGRHQAIIRTDILGQAEESA